MNNLMNQKNNDQLPKTQVEVDMPQIKKINDIHDAIEFCNFLSYKIEDLKYVIQCLNTRIDQLELLQSKKS